MKKHFSVILLIFFGILLVYYISRNIEEFRSLTFVNPIYLIIIAVGHLLGIYLNGLFLKYILEPFDKKISNIESFKVSLISTLGNYFLPVGTGAGIKAVYLKKKFKVSYTDFISTLYGNYIIVFLIGSFIGLISLIFLRSNSLNKQYWILLFVFSLVFSTMLYMAVFGFPKWVINKTNKKNKIVILISSIINGWNTIVKNRKLIKRLILITIFNFIISAAITYLAVLSIDLHINIWALLLYTSLGVLSFLLNITPGSIGIRETIIIFSSTVIGFSVPQVLSISIIEKGTLFIVLLISWLLVQKGILKNNLTNESK